MNFVALDFETANWYRKSACSIGLVKVVNGEIVDSFYSLIKPTPFWFHPVNRSIHGLDELDCKAAPTFKELWPRIKGWIDGEVIVGHNVSFEKSVLKHLSIEYDIDINVEEFLCSLYLSRVAFPNRESYKLSNIYNYVFRESMGKHHHALDDAKASAELVIKIVDEWNPPTFKGMIQALYEEPVKKRKSFKTKRSLALLIPDEGYENNTRLKGKVFVFTGEQSGYTKEEAAQFVVNNGGKANDNVTKSTTTLVIGRYKPQYGKDYKSSKVLKAESLVEKGQNIEFLSEQEFLLLAKR